MKKIILVGMFVLIGMCFYHFAFGDVKTVETKIAEPVLQQPSAQGIWIYALEWCESHGNPKAINPKDLDNTPSYGAFQFKPRTFSALAKAYGIKGEFMDPIAQQQIVARMINDKSMNLHVQFPGCTKKIGMPPPEML